MTLLNFFSDFLTRIIGNTSPAEFCATLFYAYLTAFALLLFRTTKRDVSSLRTPFKFSWSFLWCDNMKRIIANVIMIFIAARFAALWIPEKYLQYTGVAVGVIGDQLGLIFEALGRFISKYLKNTTKS